ncbi:MAG: nitric oxide reductase transcriptional regulator NorR [Corticimicrobacter sp.]|uniref:nitric oxide reductase transcriptional regulator NorR n=1 Tax=Corticimicrobacter sp. TaxID=2678536 RepID=UPI0032D9C74D
MIEDLLLTDLTVELPKAVRLQRLVSALQAEFHCGAVVLLQLEEDALRPVAACGLVREALGRRFIVAQHPRLAAILARRDLTSFSHDSTLPDPYDGLLENHAGAPMPVHDCMGISLYVESRLWGVLTLDALQINTFDQPARDAVRRCTAVVEAAIRVTRIEQQIHALRLNRQADPVPGKATDSGADAEIIGQSGALTALLQELDVVADSSLPVLLLGETGVGKELFARRLHRVSPRRNHPLIHVNCAALPESLAESELFGHAKGAFSGATAERPGRFEAADGGTLFLDEVGELPLSVQAKLLRALQNGEIQRLGADHPRRVDVRIIAATNRQLQAEVSAGHFRADLYHRLSVYPVPIPPLRERDHDVLLLAGHFLELNRTRLGLRSLRLSPEAEQALLAYRWPGNIRELEHVVSRAAIKIISKGAQRSDIVTLGAELLDLDLNGLATEPAAQHAAASSEHPTAPMALPVLPGLTSAVRPLRDVMDDCQRRCIEHALQAAQGNWTQAARQLDVDASNLHKLARRLGLKA